MVALNGLGLILFFIPGVIAFVVDFHTGAIYLPARPMAMKPALNDGETFAATDHPEDTEAVIAAISNADDSDKRIALKKIAVSTEALNLATIEQTVAEHVGKPVLLSEASSRVTELETLDDFGRVTQLHEADRSFGLSPKHFFRRWLPASQN